MKNTYLILSFLFINLLSAQIPNNSFENWDTVSMGDMLDGWMSTNDWYPNTVTRTTDAASGDYAIRMQGYLMGSDSAFAAIFNGDPGDLTGGIPFTQKPDSLKGYYKYHIAGNDTGTIMLIFTSASHGPLTMLIEQITGTENNYIPFSYPITWDPMLLGISPDSLVIAFSPNNVESSMDTGSYLYLDNISFTGTGITDTIPNSDFENWTNLEYDDPTDWSSIDQYLAAEGKNSSIKTTDAYDGNYALILETVLMDSWGDTVGNIFSGELSISSPPSGFPYTGNPKKLTGYYKFTSTDPYDSASVFCQFTQANMGMTGGGEHYFGTTNTYTYFECPLYFFGTNDSVLIAFESGRTLGNQLFLDSLNFSNKPLMVSTDGLNYREHCDIRKISSNQLLLEYYDGGTGPIRVLIHDMLGRECYNQSISNTGGNIAETLYTGSLNRGIYLIEIESSKRRLSKKVYIE